MKTAVIFFGFFRTFEQTKQSFKDHIMDPLDADIYFSTPKTLFHDTDIPVGSDVIDFFGNNLKSYELIDYDINKYKDFVIQNNIPERNYAGTLAYHIASQCNGRSLSTQVFQKYINENKIEYDLVILTRPDLKYHTKFDCNKVDYDKINCPSHYWDFGRLWNPDPHTNRPPQISKGLGDIVLAGSQKNMLVYASMYDNIAKYSKEGMEFLSECLVPYHLIKNNIDWCGQDIIQFEIIRPIELERTRPLP